MTYLVEPNTSLEAYRKNAQELLENDNREERYYHHMQRQLWFWKNLDNLRDIRPIPSQVAAWHLNEAVKISQAYDDQNITMKEFFLAGESGSYWYHRGELQAHLDSADHFSNLGG